MLLKISTNKTSARDLSFLLHKHPEKLQSIEMPMGQVHVFYPHVNDGECTICLLLDINPVSLLRNSKRNSDFALAHYVNDRPYVASSFMSAAIAKAFGTAMNGTCKNRPELVEEVWPFELKIAVLPAPKGGELLIRKLFEPLGYAVQLKRHELDNNFPSWGDSRYFTVILKGEKKLKDLLSHLYVLIPVLDSQKHYWVSQSEVEKLLKRGQGWLNSHPEKEQITRRYLKGIGELTRNALDKLLESDDIHNGSVDDSNVGQGFSDELSKRKESLHNQRLNLVLQELKSAGAEKVLDLGCGEGKLIKLLLKEQQFTKILGMDVSFRTLEKAIERLHYHEIPPRQKERIKLIQGALTYRDRRLEGFDAAAIVEVIEHLDLDRLKSFERVVFEFARPSTVVLTTPNQEYNLLFESMEKGQLRHSDHRFEWTRIEFREWVDKVCKKYGYKATIKPIGEVSDTVGAPSQMAVFHLHPDY